MMPSDILSVSLFKKSVAEYLPDYISMDNEVVFKTIQSALDNNNQIYDSAIIISQELEQNQINLKEVLDNFLTDLADYYVQSPSLKDPIIEQLLKLNHPVFLSKISDASDLHTAIQRSERKRLKELLIAQEEQREEEDIPAAFQRIERKEKKKQLQELEEAEDLMPTGSGFAAYSQIEELNDEYQFNKSAKSKNQIPWKFVIRVAAILILVLIPVGISIYFFNGGSGSVTNGKSKNNKEDNNVIYAETGDLTELKEIKLPEKENIIIRSEYNKSYSIQGFGKPNSKEVKIILSYNGNQIKYLVNKIYLINLKISELKNKNIKDKAATLTSLSEISSKCKLDKQALELKDLTYEFDSKNFKLTVYSKNKIDPKKLKVYSIKNNDESLSYFLKLFDKYYSLSKSKGSLGVVTNQELLDKLEEID